MTPHEQALAAIKAHEAAIARGSAKARQHEKSIAYYRAQFNIPPPPADEPSWSKSKYVVV